METENAIKCPKCGTAINVSKVLYHQHQEQIKKDFAQQIRPLQNDFEVKQLATFLTSDADHSIEKIYISQKQADILSSHLSNKGASIQVVGVSDLQSFITTIWPDMVVGRACQ